jgi:multiple sugar transport system ATP-binding protein
MVEMATIKLENITKKFKDITALNNVSFNVEDGEFFCLLGPPGAGKTTTLRTILGLEKQDDGIVYIDGENVNKVHPSRRDIAMIFQNLALYPDKTVFNNIASPLRVRELEEEDIKAQVVEVAKKLKIDWLLEKTPGQLSGGERQRVAIGRAIVRQPRAYLMDEPLSNLDAKLRLKMRVSLKELQSELKQTFVYVTHDQVEALSMSDRIGVLDEGVLQQIGKPEDIYRNPNNVFVAKILGNPSMNFIKCAFGEKSESVQVKHSVFSLSCGVEAFKRAVRGFQNIGAEVMLGIRPEDIAILFEKQKDAAVPAEVYVTEPLGNKTIVDVKIGEEIIKVIAQATFSGKPGQKIWLKMKESKFHLFDIESGNYIFHATEDSPLQVN